MTDDKVIHVVIHVFTRMTEVETIKRKTRATNGYRPKSVTAGLGCGLSCSPALSVTTAQVNR